MAYESIIGPELFQLAFGLLLRTRQTMASTIAPETAKLHESVREILSACRESYQAVRRQTVLYRDTTRGSGKWCMGVCRVTVIEQGSTSPGQIFQDYGNIVYEDLPLTFDEATKWFEELMTRSEWKPAGKLVDFRTPIHFSHSYETDKDWHPVKYPCHWIRTRMEPVLGITFDPLLAKGLPSYPGVGALVNHRFGFKEHSGNSWLSEINIYLPSDAARIEQISFRGKRVDARLHLPSKPAQYSLEVWARNRTGHFFGNKLVQTARETLRLEASPNTVVVFLLDKDHVLIDKKEAHVKTKGETLSRSPSEWQVRILDGESQNLEFKNFANTKTGPLKSQKDLFDKDNIAREMVAFANTNAGDILIGVEDEGTIRGVEDVRATKEDIANVAHGKCEPPITPKIFTVKFTQGTVVGIHVETGTKIHMANHVPYIRRNSTTRKAMSSELDQILDKHRSPFANALGDVLTWAEDDTVVR